MRIVVIIKEVPDTEARIELDGGIPNLAATAMIVNPYDEYAVEEALRISEREADSTVVAVMVGRQQSQEILRKVLALGVHEAVLLADPALAGSGPLQVAIALKALVSELKPDLILGGRQGVDYDWGLAGIALAELLDWPHVGLISKLELAGGGFRAESEGDDGKQITEGRLPALFTTDKGINEPRYASLKGIMAAKKKPLAVKTLADIGVDPAAVNAGVSGVQLLGCSYPAAKQGGRIIGGETVAEKVAGLIKALREEAKVI
jgi:electron transfer flavoprotein beta subunit